MAPPRARLKCRLQSGPELLLRYKLYYQIKLYVLMCAMNYNKLLLVWKSFVGLRTFYAKCHNRRESQRKII